MIAEDRQQYMEIAADLAMVFHWSPDVIDNLFVDEIPTWHKLAGERWKKISGVI